MTNPFDPYDFRARLQPAFLSILPLVVGMVAIAPQEFKVVTIFWSLLGASGLTFFLANLARNRGKTIEGELWKKWGGVPTTQLLRHRGPQNATLRVRWHKQLQKINGGPLPSKEEEEADPAGADRVYEAVTRLLIGKVRDRKSYPFVFRDNMNYGFCRNLYALKRLGIFCSICGLLASSVSTIRAIYLEGSILTPVVCVGICGLLLFWWVFTINANWVKVPAMSYAAHLFESLEKVAGAKSGPKT